MNKKILVSLAGAALLSLGLGTTTAKAENVISPNPTNTTANNGATTGTNTTGSTTGTTTNNGTTTGTTTDGKTGSTTGDKTGATTGDKTGTTTGDKTGTTTDNKTATTTNYTLTHNSYTYDLNGKRIKTPTLKKGQTVKGLGKITINKVTYIQVSKNGYIKEQNTTPSKNVAKVRYSLNHNAYVYTAKGKRANKKTMKKGKYVYVVGTKTIKGKNCVQISGSKKQFVKWANLNHNSAKVILANN